MDLELGRFLQKSPKGRWEHACALNALIQDVKQIERKRERGIHFAEMFWRHWHQLHYLELFENVLGVVGSRFQASDFKATDEFLDEVQEALNKDITLFGIPKPAHFESVETWKLFETARMLKEMDVQHTDEYQMVLGCYNAYNSYPRGSFKKESLDFRVMVNYMTLVERIEVLEQVVLSLKK